MEIKNEKKGTKYLNMQAAMMALKTTVTIFVEYNDGSEFHFDVTIEGVESEIVANLLMITRGTLMVSLAKKATCYKSDGFELCSYIK